MAYFDRERADIIPYSVGNRVYSGGMPAPTTGPVDKLGYQQRDLEARARRYAVLNRMKAQQAGNYASADAQRVV